MLPNPDSCDRFLKRFQPGGGFLMLLSFVLLISAGPPAHAADSVAPDTRLTVALLSFADKTGDPRSAHWRYSLPRMVGAPLFAVNQALSGDQEGALRTVAKILEDDPDDIQTQGLQRFLEEPRQQ